VRSTPSRPPSTGGIRAPGFLLLGLVRRIRGVRRSRGRRMDRCRCRDLVQQRPHPCPIPRSGRKIRQIARRWQCGQIDLHISNRLPQLIDRGRELDCRFTEGRKDRHQSIPHGLTFRFLGGFLRLELEGCAGLLSILRGLSETIVSVHRETSFLLRRGFFGVTLTSERVIDRTSEGLALTPNIASM